MNSSLFNFSSRPVEGSIAIGAKHHIASFCLVDRHLAVWTRFGISCNRTNRSYKIRVTFIAFRLAARTKTEVTVSTEMIFTDRTVILGGQKALTGVFGASDAIDRQL